MQPQGNLSFTRATTQFQAELLTLERIWTPLHAYTWLGLWAWGMMLSYIYRLAAIWPSNWKQDADRTMPKDSTAIE